MKKIIVLFIAITLFILPVSADNLAIGEWGMGVVRPRDVDKDWTQNTWKIINYPYTLSYGSSANTLYLFTQFGWLSDYTYTVTIDYKTSQKSYFTNLDFDFFTSDGYTINSNYTNYQNVKWNIIDKFFYDDTSYPFIVTKSESPWVNPDDPNTNYYHISYTIVFSNAIVNLSDMDYLLGRWNSSLPNVGVEILQPNMDVSAFYDPGGQIYEEVIVDLIEQIINAGSDHSSSIPSNAPELESTVGNLDRAEQNLYDRSDELLSSVQPQLNNYITQASSSAESFLPVAGFVTNVFTKTREALPPYVVVLFTVIPLLLFVGWLIGRFK